MRIQRFKEAKHREAEGVLRCHVVFVRSEPQRKKSEVMKEKEKTFVQQRMHEHAHNGRC